MDVKTIKDSDYFEWLKYKHYAKRIPPITKAFGLYDNVNELIGICTSWNYLAIQKFARFETEWDWEYKKQFLSWDKNYKTLRTEFRMDIS